jgi:hypothetical protein
MRKGVCPAWPFLAEENNDFKLGVQVMPAGIYFSDYENMRSILHISFGKPIMVKDFQGPYRDNPQKAMLKLRDAIGEQLKELSLNIRSQEYYDAFYCAAEIYAEPLLAAQGEKRINQQKKFQHPEGNDQCPGSMILDAYPQMRWPDFGRKCSNCLNLLKEVWFEVGFFQTSPKKPI